MHGEPAADAGFGNIREEDVETMKPARFQLPPQELDHSIPPPFLEEGPPSFGDVLCVSESFTF